MSCNALCADECGSDPLHAFSKRRSEADSNLIGVCGSVVTRQDNALRDSSPVGRHGLEQPLKREDGSVEEYLDDEGGTGPNVTDLPTYRFLSGKPRRSPRTLGEGAVELKLSGRIVPVLDIRPPVPGECWTDLSFD